MKSNLTVYFVLSILLGCLNVSAQSPKPLTELKPVPGGSLDIVDHPFSYIT